MKFGYRTCLPSGYTESIHFYTASYFLGSSWCITFCFYSPSLESIFFLSTLDSISSCKTQSMQIQGTNQITLHIATRVSLKFVPRLISTRVMLQPPAEIISFYCHGMRTTCSYIFYTTGLREQ